MAKLDFDRIERNFAITMLPPAQTIYSVPAGEILSLHSLQQLLAHVTVVAKAWDEQVAAAYIARWTSTILLAQQYLMSIYNTSLDFSLSNMTVHIVLTDQGCKAQFQLHDWTESPAPIEPEGRKNWRYLMLYTLYREMANPLFEQLSLVTGIALDALWGQLPSRIMDAMDR